MNGVTASEDDLVKAVTIVAGVADSYGEAIGVLAGQQDAAGRAFEPPPDHADDPTTAGGSWNALREEVWRIFADVQDAIYRSAEDLAEYTRQTYDLDGENAKTVDAAADHEPAARPEGD